MSLANPVMSLPQTAPCGAICNGVVIWLEKVFVFKRALLVSLIYIQCGNEKMRFKDGGTTSNLFRLASNHGREKVSVGHTWMRKKIGT